MERGSDPQGQAIHFKITEVIALDFPHGQCYRISEPRSMLHVHITGTLNSELQEGDRKST